MFSPGFWFYLLHEIALNPDIKKDKPQRYLTVCHVASGDLWAGAEVQVASLLQALHQLHDLRVSAVLLNKGRLLDELSGAGIPVTLIDESRKTGWTVLNELRAYFQEAKPQIVHSHRYKEHILSAFAAKLSHNPIVIQTYHGLEENLRGVAALKMAGYTWLTTVVGNLLARGVIGVSEDIAARLQRRSPFASVHCIRNGLDLERVVSTVEGSQMRQELGIPVDAFVVGSVGRLVSIKGIEYLIKALGLLVRGGEAECRRLIIVGDGPLKLSLEQLAEKQGVAGQVVFLGERRDVYRVMRAFDVFALPSLHEGVPMVLLEAMAIGVPIVASGVGGIPEVVTDGKEAFLIPAQDPQAIAKAIERIQTSTELRTRMIEAARHRVQAQFSIRNTARFIRDMYRELSAAG